MDALAAALLAKKKFSILFRKVESALDRRNLQCSDDVKELLIKRKSGNINQAVQLLKKV
jgi:predicted RNase H-like nuclease (RuvC/YqgF family)